MTKKDEARTATTIFAVAFLMTALVASTANAQLSSYPSDEFIDLTGTHDHVFGNAGDDLIMGGGGQDVLDGGSGNDNISGGDRTDILLGGVGDDVLSGDNGSDVVTGGSGDDKLWGGPGDDVLNGDSTNCDWIPKAWESNQVSDTSDPDFGNTSITFDGYTHGPSDMIHGYSLSPIQVFRGCDSARVVSGNDTLLGGPGDDVLVGDNGSDTASYMEAASGIVIDLVLGRAKDDGDGGVDTLYEIENVIGSMQGDVIRGDDGANILKGIAGNDRIEGRRGNDLLMGNMGSDTFVFAPGDGNDLVLTFTSQDSIDVMAFGFQPVWTETVVGSNTVITVHGGSPEDDVTITLKNYIGRVNYLYEGRLQA